MKKLIKLLIFAVAFQLLGSCVKDDLYNTPHPDRGAVQVTTDWTGRSSDATLPASYLLRIGDEEQNVSGATNAFNALFLPGQQDLLVYHPASGITVSGNTATVNTLPDGTLESLPGYLFSAAHTLEIPKDDTLRVTVKMRQLIRRLTLSLKLQPGDEQRIRSTSATLTGIASAIDLATGAVVVTEGKNVVPAFALEADGGNTRAAPQPQLAATLRLAGVANGEKQLLTIVFTLTDGSTQTLVTDLTDVLKNFGDSIEPLSLDATLKLADEEAPVGVTTTVTDWTPGNGSGESGTAE